MQRFAAPGKREQVSTKGGTQPRWRADGKELFYIALDGTLMAAPCPNRGPGRVGATGTPVPLFPARAWRGPECALRSPVHRLRRWAAVSDEHVRACQLHPYPPDLELVAGRRSRREFGRCRRTARGANRHPTIEPRARRLPLSRDRRADGRRQRQPATSRSDNPPKYRARRSAPGVGRQPPSSVSAWSTESISHVERRSRRPCWSSSATLKSPPGRFAAPCPGVHDPRESRRIICAAMPKNCARSARRRAPDRPAADTLRGTSARRLQGMVGAFPPPSAPQRAAWSSR